MYAEEYLLTQGQHTPSLPVDADTKQMASVQPQVSSPSAALQIPHCHTQLQPTAGLVPGNKENTHYCALNPWLLSEGGGCFDWTADAEMRLKFLIWTRTLLFQI